MSCELSTVMIVEHLGVRGGVQIAVEQPSSEQRFSRLTPGEVALPVAASSISVSISGGVNSMKSASFLSCSACSQPRRAQVTRRGATVYAWESIRAVELGEFYGNAAVLIGLSDEPVVSRFDRTGQALPADPRWAAREAWNRDVQRQLSGFDLAVMGVLTESGPGVLARQVVDLLTNYDARAALPTVAQAVSDLAGGSGRGR